MAEEKSGGQTAFIFFLRFLKVFSVLACLFNIVAYILTIKSGIEAVNLDGLEKTFLFLANTGFIILCIALIISEFEPKVFMQFVMVLHYWAGRGFAMMWMGIQTINGAKQLGATFKANGINGGGTIETVGVVAGWILISVGLLYVIMSVLCLRKCLGEEENELGVGLMSGDRTEHHTTKNTTVVNVTSDNAADALLVANMAIAMGMSADDCRKRFSGKDGKKAAEKYMKERATQAASHGATAARDYAASQPAVQAASKAAAELPTYNRDSGVSYSQPPTTTNASLNDDDDGPRRRTKQEEDEELERLYYAGRSTE